MACKLFKGTIKDFNGSWHSGLATITIKDSKTKQEQIIPCENGQTVRMLDAAFGGVIVGNHSAKLVNVIGKEIYWHYGDYGGILGWFIPVDQADEEIHNQYLVDSK